MSRFFLYPALLGDLAQSLGRIREYRQSRTEIESALARSMGHEELWCIAERLRIKGELIVRENAADAPALAEEQFRQSLDWARRQGALLGTSDSHQPCPPVAGAREARCGAGHACRFTERLGTADLRAAKIVLEALP
jgi:hypothetical protein